MASIDFSKIKKMIKNSSNVFLMGHKNIDLDAFAGCLGMCCYASVYNKKSYVIIGDTSLEAGVKKTINKFKNKINILTPSKVREYIKDNSLLIIVDTNKKSLLQDNKILSLFKNIIVLDHHDTGKDTVNGDNCIVYSDTSYSSVSEIITLMLSQDNYIIKGDIATVLLSGIVLDTTNFVLKTTSDTYYAAYYLTSCEANNKEVQYILKQDIKEYVERQKIITDAKIVNSVAISRGLQTRMYRREDLAKAADTLLLFDKIEASIVIGKVQNGVGISARSMGRINVGKLMEQFGGGGNNTEAAAVIADKSLNEIVDMVKSAVKKIKR